ncbi:D-serine ammonia-lyase [Mesorhizobium sp. WSM4310]|uniref:D-serine ammonia-lyase n=1 Tax=Mesorhizobium sp. WSM4310 TaxID=2589883 RepID=UPI00115E6A91|nr:D-serine ammonia-lyase [Mesorhizobium sp. WSM4310]TRC89722.1 D-serine ammonia-lyase [Mesorhizobium sp. WSM4310]
MNIRLPDDPARSDVLAARPTLWLNPNLVADGIASSALPVRQWQVTEAQGNWERLAPVLQRLFPELKQSQGRIRSDLIDARELADALGDDEATLGRLLIKADNNLPVAGSIKARGGIYEVAMHAEHLAREHGVVRGDGLDSLTGEKARALFAWHTIAVGSTGNLGLSVGIAARALGFQAVVHMSSDAKAWKVERLRRLGVQVVQHPSDYTQAVERARAEAEADPLVYFVDDERSQHLFFGYSAAAHELADQLAARGVDVDAEHPLFLYLPCGIGGAPGGVTYGAKAVFGDNVHCFFVEPVQSPCALVHMMSGSDKLVSVYDVGLTNKTEADGMAVARMSAFVAEVMRPLLSGIFTVDDDDLFRWLYLAKTRLAIQLEPSATASFAGPGFIANSPAGRTYLSKHVLEASLPNATHVLWTTGGAFVPAEQFEMFLERGAQLTQNP